jgi:diguanylate cyclase (GGDEF)-like protein
MHAPAIPENETERAASLVSLSVLDTPTEPRFDEITELAAYVLNTPIAAISFIDSDRQWFKAATGIDLDETAREISFCGHTIAILKTLVVNDTHDDPRFIDNPFVTDEPHIRAYAGVPVVVDPHLPVGTLCVLDIAPRNFNDGELRALQILASQVAVQLRAARTERAATDSLTGAASREAAGQWLTRQSTAYTRAAIYLDLDGLKPINDRHSHEAGNRLLAVVAERLTNSVDPAHMVARLGGDEFVVLLNDVTEADLARTTARIRQAIDRPVAWRGFTLPCSASIGAAVALPGEPGEGLIDAADRAMYIEKRLRRGL